MRYSILLLVSLLSAGIASADDPGERDSLIIESIYFDPYSPPPAEFDVMMYTTTDDSVMFYNIPLILHSQDNIIYASEISYLNTLLLWDEVYDSTLHDQGFTRMIGWADLYGADNPPILTDNQRGHFWSFHFVVDEPGYSGVVVIDTTHDSVNGSLFFGLAGGVIDFTPVFVPGFIYYCVPSDAGGDESIPFEFALLQNYPNPFNTSTTIEFTLPEAAEVELSVYNILGQKVAILLEGQVPAGKHGYTWDAGNAPSGVYFARLEKEQAARIVKMVLVK